MAASPVHELTVWSTWGFALFSLLVYCHARWLEARGRWGDARATPLLPNYTPVLGVAVLVFACLSVIVPQGYAASGDDDDDDADDDVFSDNVALSCAEAFVWGSWLAFVLLLFMQRSVTARGTRRAALWSLPWGALHAGMTLVCTAFDVPNLCGVPYYFGVAALVTGAWSVIRRRRASAVPFCVLVIAVYSLFGIIDALENLTDMPAFVDAGKDAINFVWWLAQYVLVWLALHRDSQWWRGLRGRLAIKYARGRKGAASVDDALQPALHAALEDNADLLLDWAPLQVMPVAIGRGGYAAVYFATFRGEPVAAKVFEPREVTDETVLPFLAEARLGSELSHPNIIGVRGLVVCPPSLLLLLEFADLGNLRDALDDGVPWTAAERLELARQAASAVAYLHARPAGGALIHRDIKSLNMLLSSCGGDGLALKLGDFGESVMADDGRPAMTSCVGSVPWMAPELITSSKQAVYTRAVDVYSLGVTVFEILTGRMPWADVKSAAGVYRRVCDGERPELPDDCPLPELVAAMWHADPAQRPAAADVERRLAAAAADVDPRAMARKCLRSSRHAHVLSGFTEWSGLTSTLGSGSGLSGSGIGSGSGFASDGRAASRSSDGLSVPLLSTV